MTPLEKATLFCDEVQSNFSIGALHQRFVFSRRTKVLSDHLARMIPFGCSVLDVGCGDGTIDCLIKGGRPDLSIEGIDPLIRPRSHVPVRWFNGATIPHENGSFDVVMFVDVLHHCPDPSILLREAGRVGKTVLIKDHFLEGFLAGPTLRVMDWVGNARYGVALPYNYWTKRKWLAALEALSLRVVDLNVELGLYPAPLSWLFERQLHFIARCDLR